MEKPNMMQSLNCPNCSAPLDIPERTGSNLSCPYCHSLLVQKEGTLVKHSDIAGVAGSRRENLLRTQDEIDHKVEFIREMAQAGNKIVAVNALRNVFKINKNKAQELVDAMARGELVDSRLLPPVFQAVKTFPALDPNLMQKLLELVRKGEKIEAIKLFRQGTGAGLKDAKDVIDLLQANLSASPRGNLTQTGADLL
jgi:ribosomal protein L7/L12